MLIKNMFFFQVSKVVLEVEHCNMKLEVILEKVEQLRLVLLPQLLIHPRLMMLKKDFMEVEGLILIMLDPEKQVVILRTQQVMDMA